MAALLIALALIALAAEKWSIDHALEGVEYDVETDRALVEIDQPFQVITTVVNRSRRLVPFLRMTENLPRAMKTNLTDLEVTGLMQDRVTLRSTTYLRPRQRLTRAFDASLPARGRFFLKGATLYGGDFLGMRETPVEAPLMREIVVMPAPWERPDFDDTLGGFLGDASVNRFILEDPVLTLGFRDYTGREPQKWIAWPQTLRAGKMMVKNFDHTVDLSVCVLLNVHDPLNLARNHARMERAFSMARSVCEALEDRGVSYAFITNAMAAGSSAPFRHIPEGLGGAHLSAVLEGLGRATYDSAETFYEMLERALRDAEQGRAHILVTIDYPEEYARAVRRLEEMTGGAAMALCAADADGEAATRAEA